MAWAKLGQGARLLQELKRLAAATRVEAQGFGYNLLVPQGTTCG